VRDARDFYGGNDLSVKTGSPPSASPKRSGPVRDEIDTYCGKWLDKFIMGIEPMSKWDAFSSHVRKMDLQTTIDIYQKAMDRLLKKQGGRLSAFKIG
jgi:putative aldouronate transport system substrate-binding protein